MTGDLQGRGGNEVGLDLLFAPRCGYCLEASMTVGLFSFSYEWVMPMFLVLSTD